MRAWRLPAIILLSTAASFVLWPFGLTHSVNDLLVLAGQAATDAEGLAAYTRILADSRAASVQRFAAAAAAGQCAKRLGDQEKAVEFFRAALAESPATELRWNVQLELADSLLLEGRAAETAQLLGDMTETVTNPELRRVMRERYAAALEQIGDYPGAVRQYEKLLAETPAEQGFNLRIQLTHVLATLDETVRARQVLAETRAIDAEQRATLLWTEAQVLCVAGERRAAREAFAAFIALDEISPAQKADARLQIATLELQDNDVSAACQSLRRAADLGADRLQLALRLGEAAGKLPPEEAEKLLVAWQNDLAERPEALVFLLKERGRLALARGKKEQALAIFSQAREISVETVDSDWLDETIVAIEHGETN